MPRSLTRGTQAPSRRGSLEPDGGLGRLSTRQLLQEAGRVREEREEMGKTSATYIAKQLSQMREAKRRETHNQFRGGRGGAEELARQQIGDMQQRAGLQGTRGAGDTLPLGGEEVRVPVRTGNNPAENIARRQNQKGLEFALGDDPEEALKVGRLQMGAGVEGMLEEARAKLLREAQQQPMMAQASVVPDPEDPTARLEGSPPVERKPRGFAGVPPGFESSSDE